MAVPAEDPDRFLLPTKFPGDDRQFLPPARRGAKVTPLIDARKAYAAMEEAVLEVRSTVHFCWWEFDPFTPLTSKAVRRAVGGADWVDLLQAKAVGTRVSAAQIRMIISDCDAILFDTMHEKAWSAVERMQTRRVGLSAAAQARLEIIVGLHPARVAGFDGFDFVSEKALNAAIALELEGSATSSMRSSWMPDRTPPRSTMPRNGSATCRGCGRSSSSTRRVPASR